MNGRQYLLSKLNDITVLIGGLYIMHGAALTFKGLSCVVNYLALLLGFAI